MGSSVGAAAKAGGSRVVWASAGRSEATKARAGADGLEDVGTLAELVEQSDIIISICPPSAAEGVARQVIALKFKGIYVDANAISPETARAIANLFQDAGASFVDGGIIGPPARAQGSTRLYLSGEQAEPVAAFFAVSPLNAIALVGEIGKASALKVAYAAWTKGTSALLLAVRAFARAEGVEQDLFQEWALSQPELAKRTDSMIMRTPQKAWRFAGEMNEIASAFGSAGLPEGFHQAAEEIYARLEAFKGVAQAESEEVLAALSKPSQDTDID